MAPHSSTKPAILPTLLGVAPVADEARLKARLEQTVSLLAKREQEVGELRSERDALKAAIAIVRKRHDEDNEFGPPLPLATPVDDSDRKYPALGGKSIIDRIREYFIDRPGLAFSPAEVMTDLRIPFGNTEAVRSSFKRLLFRDHFLRRAGHAKYALEMEAVGVQEFKVES